MSVFRYLEKNPIIDIGKTSEALDLSFNTVSSAINRLIDAGIVIQTENAARNRTFAYEECGTGHDLQSFYQLISR